MGYSNNNKIRIYAEDATNNPSEINGIVYDDTDWINIEGRWRGAKEGIAKSQEVNTALKQSTLLATILSEMIVRRYGTMITTNLSSSGYSDFASYVEAIANKYTKDNFLFDGEVKTKHIADSQVTTSKILDLNITTSKIANDAVTTEKIPNSAVTEAKIKDANVTTSKIKDGNVTRVKLNTDITSGIFGSFTSGKLMYTEDTQGEIKIALRHSSGITSNDRVITITY